MPFLFGRDMEPEELMKRVGDISQVAGLERFELREGAGRGMEAIRARSGHGLDITVLPGRGLDIAEASYRGLPLAWISPVGRVAPTFYEPEGLGWLRGFSGGMMTTCGLTAAGFPSREGDVETGLHGRYSYTPATHVCLEEGWHDGDYLMEISGRVRQAVVFGENLELERRLVMKLGEPVVGIEDRVVNLGYEDTDFMILYHLNFGYPLISDDTVLRTTSREVLPRDDTAKAGLGEYACFQAPQHGFREQVFYHRHHPDGAGLAHAVLINPGLLEGRGLALHLSYNVDTLPWMVQWRMCGEGHYVMGLEPSNCWVGGRAEERAAGRLQTIKAGSALRCSLRLAVIEGREEIEELCRRLERAAG